eukprot:15447802-Alexandrium_andersonii.AAC.1
MLPSVPGSCNLYLSGFSRARAAQDALGCQWLSMRRTARKAPRPPKRAGIPRTIERINSRQSSLA